MNENQPKRYELARQFVVNFAAGLAGYLGPGAGALAVGSVPLVLAALDHVSKTIGSRRLDHVIETVIHGADDFGAKTPEEFVAFVEAAVSDEEHQELLARALTIAQDTAMRDKRRALGRALASAASEVGTKVDDELQFIRVLADLDEPHIRVLRIASTIPPHLEATSRHLGRPVRQWYPWSIAEADPGLADTSWALLETLERHGLLWSSGEQLTRTGMEPEYTITQYGEWFLARLAEPEE